MITPSAEKDRLNNESLDEANKFAEHRSVCGRKIIQYASN